MPVAVEQLLGDAEAEHVHVERRRLADLLGGAEAVREPTGGRVDVNRAGDHVGTLPEDLLRAVAVVEVDVEQGDAARTLLAQALGGAGGVVDVAIAAGGAAAGVGSLEATAPVVTRYASDGRSRTITSSQWPSGTPSNGSSDSPTTACPCASNKGRAYW